MVQERNADQLLQNFIWHTRAIDSELKPKRLNKGPPTESLKSGSDKGNTSPYSYFSSYFLNSFENYSQISQSLELISSQKELPTSLRRLPQLTNSFATLNSQPPTTSSSPQVVVPLDRERRLYRSCLCLARPRQCSSIRKKVTHALYMPMERKPVLERQPSKLRGSMAS